ncbi:Rrf2 family transcriptional regulator [uncultured Ruminococcus sp.]|uniref:Rrf2 family transcriptional regulator n=1 Tax=uncultured Ruminococcus sp. TaxID=165186 RepID=UPI00262C08C4|nr:Rrf2 family transcriptional regulator [uncultured Ruminococcus sp.]
MRISTKVECGIIALLDIALNTHDENTVKVNAISKRNNISAKYLEQILPLLKQSELIISVKGSNGGYRLSRSLGAITLYEIVNALDRSILSSSEFSKELEQNATDAIEKCLWRPMTSYLRKYTQSLTLKDLTDMYYERKSYNDDISFISACV